MAIVYQHRRLDTNEIFYIGIGKTISRSKVTSGRNEIWQRITKKTDYAIDILFDKIDWDTACEIEKSLIKKYGRININTGTLSNMTDGGDGIVNYQHTEKTKELLRTLKLGSKLSQSHINKIKNSNTGRKHTKEELSKMSSSQLGDKNHMWGKNGLSVSNSKLTPDDIFWIRKNYIKGDLQYGQRPLAKKYSVSKTTIKDIVEYKLWKNP